MLFRSGLEVHGESPLRLRMLVQGAKSAFVHQGGVWEPIFYRLEKEMTIPVAGSEQAPNLLAHLASHGINARKASAAEVEQAVRSQLDDVGLIIDADFAKDWHSGVPAKVEVVTDTTRRNADVPAKRVEGTLRQYTQTVGALRLMARGINPMVGVPVGVEIGRAHV